MLEARRVHFVGIGGMGMSGIARLLLGLGFEVTGSDLRCSETTRALERLGARIAYGHRPENVEGADLVVFSSAVAPDNVELERARALGLRVVPRAQMLVEIMALHRFNIAVAGAHGKTTTSSMIAAVLTRAGLSPTVAVGGRVNGFGGNAWLGRRDYLVAEADESDGSFLRMSPEMAVVTNIDAEHLDHYRDLAEIEETFRAFLGRVPPGGTLVLCLDDPRLRRMAQEDLGRRVVTYGLDPGAEVAGQVVREGPGALFRVSFRGRPLGEVRLSLPGRHNVQNALGALAVGLSLGLPFPPLAEGLSSFSGVRRRLEVKGEACGVLVVDDYAHHPTEIRATFRALRAAWPDRRLVVVFQPHRYTRTRALFPEFVTSFDEADVLFVTEIYPASEDPIPGVSGEALAAALRRRRAGETVFAADREELLRLLRERLAPGDLLVTMGAGDVYRLGEALLAELGAGEQAA